MNVQVLIATMNQSDHSLIDRMNIQTEAIVCNQCSTFDYDSFYKNNNLIRWYSFDELGVGLNRNNALMRATGSIVLFADDDLVYVDNYEDIVLNAFSDLPDADVIIFNISSRKPNNKITRVGRLNYLRYGTARIAAKTQSIKKNGIYFNQCFGGGTEHCHGEDSLFLSDCLKNNLKIYAYPKLIAHENSMRNSSWFTGYNDKYLKDQGVLYYHISRRAYRLLCLQDAIRRHKTYNKSILSSYLLMMKGKKEDEKR